MAKIKLNGDTSGYIEISAPAVSGNNTLELGPGTKILTNLDNTFTGVSTFTSGLHVTGGSFGLGTDNPDATLKVNVASGNNGVVVQNTSTANIALLGARNGDATVQIGQWGSSASGSTFGLSNADLSFIYTTSYSTTHPSALALGTVSNKPIVFATNNTERLRIDSAGVVNIGDSSPNADGSGVLNVYSGTSGALSQFVHGAGNGGLRIGGTGPGSAAHLVFSNDYNNNSWTDEWTIRMDGSDDSLKFLSGGVTGTERIRLKSNGHIHIGNPIELANVATTTHTFALSGDSDNTFPCPGSIAISGATAYNTANYAGAGLRFLGKYTAAGQYTTFATVGGIKENTTDGNYAGALTFHTRNHGGLGGERLRITSGGHLVVGSGYADFQSGTRGEASSTDPYKLVFQNQYSNGYTDEKLKLYLFNSGTTRQGFGPGPNYDLQYHCSGGTNVAKHNFYTDNIMRMEISDAYGGVTKPTQPGFFARRAVGGDNRAASAQEWTITGTSTFNTGSHFNASNGRFTAPVAGRYIFTACPGYKQTSYDYNFKFTVNGGQQSEPVRIIDGGDDITSHSSFTGTVIYNLNANDYVQVDVGYIHHVNLTYNFFMGYLLG